MLSHGHGFAGRRADARFFWETVCLNPPKGRYVFSRCFFGLESRRLGNGRISVDGLADACHVGLGVDQGRESRADDFVVV